MDPNDAPLNQIYRYVQSLIQCIVLKNNMTVGEYEICLQVILVFFTWESGSLVLIASLHDWADQCKPLAN
jgi:hypothetical protein